MKVNPIIIYQASLENLNVLVQDNHNSLKEILIKEKDNLYDFFNIYGDKQGCYFFDEKFC